jgi:hypothetical protein
MLPVISAKTVRFVLAAALATRVFAQTSGGGATTSPSTDQFVAFDRPEAWALKYFTSASILSGLQPPDASAEARRFGSITVGMELGWIPELSRAQQNVGFNGRAFNDLNKAPILARPSIRVGLPAKFTFLAAAPAPFRVFGVTPHLLALGVERPLLDRGRWRIGWRASGQVGHVKGAFTCPRSVLGFTPGSPDNPGRCVAESHDIATLRYIGTEFQFSRRIGTRWVPHVASGINWMAGATQVHALVTRGMDNNRLWTHGKIWTESAGVSYLFSPRVALTVDAFYAPLSVRRTAASARENDGLFNVRALISYAFR